MNGRVPRFRGTLVIPLLILGVWLAGVMIVGRRGQVKATGWLDGQHGRLRISQGPRSEGDGALAQVPERLDDPRLSGLRRSADSWRKLLEPRRMVVDQVCLVSDVRSFLEAITFWDDRHYFPILIDEPAWTLPFVRSFRPARVVRYTRRAEVPTGPLRDGPGRRSSREAEWSQALAAVRSACSDVRAPDQERSRDDASREPVQAAPGLVLSAPESPMLAGAVALAAGHFQPIVRLNPFAQPSSNPGAANDPPRFHDVLTQPAAWDLARQIEDCTSARVAAYDQLGDRCDFLTLAGDWPYRYEVSEGAPLTRGVYAVDDLIGRKLNGGPNLDGLNRSRRRWAYVGRLLGDPAASVARAMAALFLPPRSVLLWNTYGGGSPWSHYAMNSSAAALYPVLPRAGGVLHRVGPRADLTNWHLTVDPANRYGLVLFNSSGGPDFFSITGGPGRPGDVPRGIPTAVAMIHSFSAADPLDPQTIAGRWLDQGAFVFFGSVREPFLLAFRTPRLVADLAAEGVPLSAALRQGEFEPFGFPWRLVYLGDPLYRLQVRSEAKPDQTVAGTTAESPGRSQGRPGSRGRIRSSEDHAASAPGIERLAPNDWRQTAPSAADWPVIEVDPLAASSSPAPLEGDRASDVNRLNWCLDAAIGELLGPRSQGPARTPGGALPNSSRNRPAGWRMVLRQVRRDRLDGRQRVIFDEFLIDALGEIGSWDELQARLERIPPEEAGPRVWEAIETCAINRLARLARDRDKAQGFAKALDVWDEVMRVSWPEGSKFPAQFTERISALVWADRSGRLEPWLERLRRTDQALAGLPGRKAQIAAIAAERARGQR